MVWLLATVRCFVLLWFVGWLAVLRCGDCFVLLLSGMMLFCLFCGWLCFMLVSV